MSSFDFRLVRLVNFAVVFFFVFLRLFCIIFARVNHRMCACAFFCVVTSLVSNPFSVDVFFIFFLFFAYFFFFTLYSEFPFLSRQLSIIDLFLASSALFFINGFCGLLFACFYSKLFLYVCENGFSFVVVFRSSLDYVIVHSLNILDNLMIDKRFSDFVKFIVILFFFRCCAPLHWPQSIESFVVLI